MKVAAWLRLLQEKGPNLHRPYADILEEPIRELRISFGRLEIRLLYKKSRQVHKEEIELAKRYRNDWLMTFGGGKP